ncbi:50S ribosomal protein L34 [Candidatus Peregrinibacteria bacterium]|nr:50S ribosomal protein L34 [Candidatus Peregrinibacteria bacterium]
MQSKGNKRKRAKRHGFLTRMKARGGSLAIKRRRTRGRKKLAV